MEDFLTELARGLARVAKKPTILAYRPNSPIHEAFHKSTAVGRLLRGGNRAGKTVAGSVEGIWRALGNHPYQKVPEPPTQGRIVTVDTDNGIERIVKETFKQWVPPSQLINGSFEDSFNGRKKIMTFANGSTIDLKTHQMEVDSFAGVPLHYVHFDEECPLAIFNECRLRLIDYNGVWWMTMTPVEGQDWIFDRFIVTKAKNVEMFEVGIESNPHLSKEALARLNEDLTDEEKEVRQKGIFVPKGGVVLKQFNYNRHVIDPPAEIPKSWDIFVSIDHGYNTPTAILWHAVSPEGKVITFKEHYMAKWVIKRHVAHIKQINREIGREPIFYVGDPSMAQKTGESGISAQQIYRENGIPLMSAKKDNPAAIDKMNEYLEYDMWVITNDCPNTIKEIRGWSFDIYHSAKIADRNNNREQPKKKNDHCPDSAKYFFTRLVWLSPEQKVVKKRYSLTESNMEDFPWQVDTQLMRGLDRDDDLSFGEIY